MSLLSLSLLNKIITFFKAKNWPQILAAVYIVCIILFILMSFTMHELPSVTPTYRE